MPTARIRASTFATRTAMGICPVLVVFTIPLKTHGEDQERASARKATTQTFIWRSLAFDFESSLHNAATIYPNRSRLVNLFFRLLAFYCVFFILRWEQSRGPAWRSGLSLARMPLWKQRRSYFRFTPIAEISIRHGCDRSKSWRRCVFARDRVPGVQPASCHRHLLHHYRFARSRLSLTCDRGTVNAGDICPVVGVSPDNPYFPFAMVSFFSGRAWPILQGEGCPLAASGNNRPVAATSKVGGFRLEWGLGVTVICTSWQSKSRKPTSRSMEKSARRPRFKAKTLGWSTFNNFPACTCVSLRASTMSTIR